LKDAVDSDDENTMDLIGVHHFDPLQDLDGPSLWSDDFHTRQWLKALHRGYCYESIGVTSSLAGEKLRNGLGLLPRSESPDWSSVSLPSSDHSEPLVESEEELRYLLSSATDSLTRQTCRHMEIRPLALPLVPLLEL
jgi:hypothetical protein